jgi:hypothetical protein
MLTNVFDAKTIGLIVVVIAALVVTFWRIRKRSLSDHDDKTIHR